MTLRLLFGIHALVTFAAGVVLVVAPDAIPRTVGIAIRSDSYLLCYLLAAAELSLSVLSWGGRTITNQRAIRVISIAFIVFHAASGLFEVGVSAVLSQFIWANVALRAIAVLLFGYYGLRKG